jgi:hypothetical protein
MEKSDSIVWTVVLEGAPLSFQVGLNPAVIHRDRTTVAHLVLEEGDLNRIKGLALVHGTRLTARSMERQSKTQEQERLVRATALDLAEMPTVACPDCSWFEPFQAEKCGALAYPIESREELLRSSEAHRMGLRNCPLVSKVRDT